MRRTGDVALRAGFYLVAAISGVAAAYVLREWVNHLWDVPSPPCTDEKPQSDAPPSGEPVADVSQPKSLPPLRTHSLPPNAHPLLSGPFVSINPGSTTPQTSLNDEDGVNEEDAAQSNTSTESDSLIDVMSPHPPRVLSKRRSMRAHDLFADRHVSFSDLGSMLAPQNEPE